MFSNLTPFNMQRTKDGTSTAGAYNSYNALERNDAIDQVDTDTFSHSDVYQNQTLK
jgi:hypothetical protein